MGGILQVDTIQNNNATTLITQTNSTTLTFGVSGQNIVIPSGVTFNTASATVTLPSTISATTINTTTLNVTTVVLAAGAVGTPSLTTSGDTNTGMFFPAADTIAFTEGGVEAMRIDSNGNVGIGTISPDSLLDIQGSGIVRSTIQSTSTSGARDAILRFNVANIGGDDPAGNIEFTYGTTNTVACSITGNTFNYLKFFTGTVERLRLDDLGALILAGSTAQKASGTTWSNPSDTRLKDNKQNYTKGLNELLQINVKTWEWNGKAGTTQGDVGIGIIADEIETILPNTIDTYKAKLNESDIEQTDIKRFDATEITWLLLNSVKEQQAIIEELKARLTALENN